LFIEAVEIRDTIKGTHIPEGIEIATETEIGGQG
jgi:hypothetical protein